MPRSRDGLAPIFADLVDGVTKLTNLELSNREKRQAENFRKLFMAMLKDMRVILVKLADRLHNMRTIRHMPQAKQVKTARETMDIFAPLAGRMGMYWMRDELEDLAFAVLNHDARFSIMRRFVTLAKGNGRRHPRGSPMISSWSCRRPAFRPMCSAAPKSRSRSGARCRKRSWRLANFRIFTGFE